MRKNEQIAKENMINLLEFIYLIFSNLAMNVNVFNILNASFLLINLKYHVHSCCKEENVEINLS